MAYGEDFRKRAMAMLAEGKSATAVCRLLGVGYVTLHRWKKRQAEGSLAAAYPKRRKAYKINEEALKSYVAAHPDAYAEEIATAIGSRPGTVASALKRLKITRKKKTPQYRERDEEKRENYLSEIEAYPEEQRIFLDESGLCHRLQRTHGYAEKGQRIHGLTYGKRQGRTNIIGAWSTINKLFAVQTYDHTVNKAVFMAWIKDHLLKHLKEGMVVIMDNAPWHKGNDIKELIESTGARLIKLPPYSPDLNPIEHAWANLKHYVKSAKHAFDSFAANLTAQILKMNHSNSR